MNEFTFVADIAQKWGLPGLGSLLIAYLIWQDRRRAIKDEEDRKERQRNAEADRAVWTNHLTSMIKESSASNRELAIGLTKLAESVNNFQSRCSQIQEALQNEVDRMMKG